MQLILMPEDTDTDIKTMSTLEESVTEKSLTNGSSETRDMKDVSETPNIKHDSEIPDIKDILETPVIKGVSETPYIKDELETPDIKVELETPDIKEKIVTPDIKDELETPKVKDDSETEDLKDVDAPDQDKGDFEKSDNAKDDVHMPDCDEMKTEKITEDVCVNESDDFNGNDDDMKINDSVVSDIISTLEDNSQASEDVAMKPYPSLDYDELKKATPIQDHRDTEVVSPNVETILNVEKKPEDKGSKNSVDDTDNIVSTTKKIDAQDDLNDIKGNFPNQINEISLVQENDNSELAFQKQSLEVVDIATTSQNSSNDNKMETGERLDTAIEHKCSVIDTVLEDSEINTPTQTNVNTDVTSFVEETQSTKETEIKDVETKNTEIARKENKEEIAGAAAILSNDKILETSDKDETRGLSPNSETINISIPVPSSEDSLPQSELTHHTRDLESKVENCAVTGMLDDSLGKSSTTSTAMECDHSAQQVITDSQNSGKNMECDLTDGLSKPMTDVTEIGLVKSSEDVMDCDDSYNKDTSTMPSDKVAPSPEKKAEEKMECDDIISLNSLNDEPNKHSDETVENNLETKTERPEVQADNSESKVDEAEVIEPISTVKPIDEEVSKVDEAEVIEPISTVKPVDEEVKAENFEIVAVEKTKDDVSKTMTAEEISELQTEDSNASRKSEDCIETPTDKDDTVKPVADEAATQAEEKTMTSVPETDIVDLDELKDEEDKGESSSKSAVPDETKKEESTVTSKVSTIRLSNTLNIWSDDDDDEPAQTTSSETRKPEPSKPEPSKPMTSELSNKFCINLDDDDDIMVIDDVAPKDGEKKETASTESSKPGPEEKTSDLGDDKPKEDITPAPKTSESEPAVPVNSVAAKIDEKPEEPPKPKPLVIPENFFKTYRKNLAEMTRDDLEEFCILKIVESIIDRSTLNEIKSKMKTMAATLEEHKQKANKIIKQNRDLQVVLKSVEKEQKNRPNSNITPLKITRSVGMQVAITEVVLKNRKPQNIPVPPSGNNRSSNAAGTLVQSNPTNSGRPQRIASHNQRTQKIAAAPPNGMAIPVPRLVPANTSSIKPTQSNAGKPAGPTANGARNSPPVAKVAEKRTLNRSQSVTVDLTDDEPPAKQLKPKSSPVAPVRLVPPQNLLTPRPQQNFTGSSPRKVYIPISGPQAQNIRAGTTVMLKGMPGPSLPRPRGPLVRVPLRPPGGTRHPAPLPDVMKQYQPPNWKALPPAPDIKLSKVENGIVISWKIDGYQDDSYEEIASYQLYAYQETSSPPSTMLWKKIGDVKALPLPMACTLTQFMAGYKYYFAVRAVDIRSRLGPFSLPGSILLLNKM